MGRALLPQSKEQTVTVIILSIQALNRFREL